MDSTLSLSHPCRAHQRFSSIPVVIVLMRRSTFHTVEGRSAVFVAQLFDLFGIRKVKRSAIKPVTFYVMSSNDAGLKAGQYWTSMDFHSQVH